MLMTAPSLPRRYELYDAVGLDPTKIKKYCDNVSNDTRRVVTVRNSTDGKSWSNDWGCADAVQKDEHCKAFHVNQLRGQWPQTSNLHGLKEPLTAIYSTMEPHFETH
jgi:hypothetical protein